VLVETIALGGRRAVIIGIGINCLQQPGHFPPDLADRATSLEIECPRAVDRAAIAGHLVARLDALLTDWAGTGWESGGAAWRARCRDAGQAVTLTHDGHTFVGRVTEIAANGDLVVRLDSGESRQFPAATTTRLWTA
jgi:BirA family transcriptional regulator, biotin operon repressor / biotin---[acetyl-CoA-carboxylase] ligase